MQLHELELFRDFPPEHLDRLAQIAEEINLEHGQTLFNAGDPGDSLCVVIEGAVRIFITLDAEKGEEKSLALLEAGAYLGEMTLIEGAPRSASARAEGPTRVVKISRAAFLDLFRQYPQAALRLFVSFLKVMGERLRRTNDELVALYDVGKVIGDSPTLDALLKEILGRLIASVRADYGAFFTLNDITATLEIVEAQGRGFDRALGVKTPAAEGLAARAIQLNKTLRIENLTQNPEYSAAPRFGYERENMLIVPLIRGDRTIGAILLGDRADGLPFDAANENLINAVASQAAAAVEAALFHQDHAAREQFNRTYMQF